MARGHIYEICTEIDNIGFLDETDLYGFCGHEAEYFKDLNDFEEKEVKDWLIECLKSHGAEIGLEEVDLPHADEPKKIPWVTFSQEVKENYFCERFEKMKQLASEMTLEKFATDAYELKRTIYDDYSDAVYLDSSFYTLDYFVREAEPGKKYYLGNIVLMH